jgi:hypothetical protein
MATLKQHEHLEFIISKMENCPRVDHWTVKLKNWPEIRHQGSSTWLDLAMWKK